eukprot:8651865-Prorocentrum_lima.AAC.1
MPAWYAVETSDGVHIDLRTQSPKLVLKLLAQDMQAASDQGVLKLRSGVWKAGVWWDIPQTILKGSSTTIREKAGLR